ncbi:2-succinyl-6-hydroxy-2,4-cyclohexadiene-1-carboxylate synthase [Avibacterium sp. 21-595]|uniref:2-succinyl-6-hydroxy-2, 4-cyclohexadiene-1-carboxylate synthase n=1 Tax=Avibacterium sp. 21-595 TaxID=2911527 RepID=UPI002025C8B3|nr:2-succinyl-6-hydroxy-2,4-cyclohexadiene-1-carboxylate synthase [Avibacterium sp. 21-595]URL06246.1 2-succinyl-6-hydroxy-2,4-cyclohexadiene-1-carboxylate synthase [Avibacterium sp. 21-595]
MAKPHLVFLHGLLGTKADWQKIIEKLPHFSCLALDLPLHGENKHINVTDFDNAAEILTQQIQSAVQNQPYFLIGYSLGGRLALYYALQAEVEKGDLQGLILEGANLGLTSEQERQQRWQNDCDWAERFATQPAHQVLEDWYQQPVFSHLTAEQRQVLIKLRQANCGENIAQMLKATSLATQPDFRSQVRSNSLPIFYLCGEKDVKFRQMAVENQLNLHFIPNAGHNAHQENPQAFSQCLAHILAKIHSI